VTVAKAEMEFFNKFVDPSFEMESLIFVTNQFGKARLSVYGLGKRKGDPAPDFGRKPAAKPAESEPAGGK
jgi:hypothetical protein